jgi:hypothetical protein
MPSPPLGRRTRLGQRPGNVPEGLFRPGLLNPPARTLGAARLDSACASTDDSQVDPESMITFERFARITTERLSGVGSLSVDTSEEVGSWTWGVLLSNGMVGVAAVYDDREKRLFGYLVRPKQGLFRRARLPSPGELDETNWFLIEEIAARRALPRGCAGRLRAEGSRAGFASPRGRGRSREGRHAPARTASPSASATPSARRPRGGSSSASARARSNSWGAGTSLSRRPRRFKSREPSRGRRSPPDLALRRRRALNPATGGSPDAPACG